MVLMLFPMLAAADSSLNFTPPSTDYSVIFLGNLFGVVDGVLHGTGSQIMGAMFGVFNAAVLALGGIVVMYTLIVGTMNTAHEGQMLGQKWLRLDWC
jgi:defect-in-organelle-trafficking protein DotA